MRQSSSRNHRICHPALNIEVTISPYCLTPSLFLFCDAEIAVDMEAFCEKHRCNILYSPSSGAGTVDKVQVELSSQFNRKMIPDLECLIEENWSTLKKELGDKLYNDEKFRINSVRQTGNDKVLIEVGITSYKEYVGTNLGKDLEVFKQHGMNEFNNQQACLSDALGVGSVVVTADDYLLLVRRSCEVAEGQGLIDFPGGHAEPKALK